MSTRNLLILLVPLIFLAGLLLGLQPALSENQSGSSGIIHDPDVERLVQKFGQDMKKVSLLASQSDLRASIQNTYGSYVATELLTVWLTNTSVAPGRQTSSPWPDRIQIGSMEQTESGFLVHGTVVEVANDASGVEQIVGTYPVQVRVEKTNGSWRIFGYEKGLYSQIPARQTIVGTYTCLPHRNTSGPQTTECAFGIQEVGTGNHYAVNTQLMSSTMWMEMPTGSRVRIEGVMTPIDQLSSNQWQKYDIVGIVSATTIAQL